MRLATTIFWDTNVLIDFLMCRPGYEYAKTIFQMGADGSVTNCISVLTVANTAYLFRKKVGNDSLEPALKDLIQNFKVLPMGEDTVNSAFSIRGTDYEDKLQMACAGACRCSYIVTDNIRHFSGTRVPTYTPEDFLNHLRMQEIADTSGE